MLLGWAVCCRWLGTGHCLCWAGPGRPRRLRRSAPEPAASDPAALPEAPCRPPTQGYRELSFRDLSQRSRGGCAAAGVSAGQWRRRCRSRGRTKPLKAQAIAAQLRALLPGSRSRPAAGWLTADPARRQGYLTDTVLRSYWGTAYEENHARLAALVDAVETQVLYYDNAPAGTSYFCHLQRQTEASENVWGTAVPPVPVDSSTDREADHFTYTVQFSTAQTEELLKGLGLAPDPSAPEGWFGVAALTPLRLCGFPAGLRADDRRPGPCARRWGCGAPVSRCSTRTDVFFFTTMGYGHGVGLSQWGAKALAQTADRRASRPLLPRNGTAPVNSKAAGHFTAGCFALIERIFFSEGSLETCRPASSKCRWRYRRSRLRGCGCGFGSCFRLLSRPQRLPALPSRCRHRWRRR